MSNLTEIDAPLVHDAEAYARVRALMEHRGYRPEEERFMETLGLLYDFSTHERHRAAMETRDSSAVRGERIELLEALLREVIDLPLISNDGINLKYRIKAVLAGGKDAAPQVTETARTGTAEAVRTPAVAAPSVSQEHKP